MLVGQRIGPFEIERELGSGAMGTVYRAKFHRSEDKIIPVALKVVAMGLLGNESAMARFEREANILKQLKHEHIVRLIAHGKINKQNPYIAMEFIDGEALDRILARRGKLTWEEVITYGKQLCEALQYAHDKGIIHRDLKPSNLMITREGKLKLTDFGIAKDTDVTALTGANSTIGTAAYMSPEQCRGERNLTNKSDLYSLGIVFFELLTGRKPFTAETTVEMFLKHCNEKAPRIGKLVPDLPPKLESLIMQLMEKDKDDRPIDAQWVGRMLQEIEDDAFARKSAGLAVAQGRASKAVNLSGERMDEADKEAARALRGKRKKKKKDDLPLLQRKWVQAVGISALLLALLAGVIWALRPPSAEKLFAAIDNATTPEAKLEAATKFLETYGSRGGELVDQAAAIFRAGKIRERERVLNNRFTSSMPGMSKPTENDDPDAYNAAWAAMEFEKLGQLDQARAQWQKVKARFPDQAALPYTTQNDELAKALWGWIAEKRLADIAKALAERERLVKKIAESRLKEIELKTDKTDPESLAIRALRLWEFGDHERAAATCDTILTLTEKDFDKRPWYLLAAQLKAVANPRAGPATRVERLRQYLDETEKLVRSLKDTPDPAAAGEVRNRCRDVRELYDDDNDPEVRKAVERAEKLSAAASKIF